MTLSFDKLRSDDLLQQPVPRHDLARLATPHSGRNVLVTGAGGSIGSALARAVSDSGPGSLVLLDSSEQNLFRIHSQLSKLELPERHIPVLGSVADERCLGDIFERYQPEVIYHAAAFKHVPLMERNPFAVVQNNVFGTFALAMAARRFRTARLIMISTDKAVNPHSIMGASKRLAELVLLALGDAVTRMTSIRLGNVLGSEGSVVPLFLEQIEHGGPVTVTHPEMERYFLSMEETVSYILCAAASCPGSGSTCFPSMREPMKIVDLARFLIKRASAENVSISYTGLRPGDKLREEFVSDRETMAPEMPDGLHWIEGPHPTEAELVDGIAGLHAAVGEMNLTKLLEAITRLVPEYEPSVYLREQVASAALI